MSFIKKIFGDANQRYIKTLEPIVADINVREKDIERMSIDELKAQTSTLNALMGKGVHVVTVNDYLARRDAVWMGQIHYSLGLSVGCINHEKSYRYDPSYKNEIEGGAE